jgi:predicted RNA-binding Zn ribbon-like protein
VAAQAGQQIVGQAPGDLAILQSFVNTLDVEQSTDEFSDQAALASWLQQAGLLDGSAGAGRQAAETASAGDLADALNLREALRVVLRTHVTHGPAATRQHGRAEGRQGLPPSADAAAQLGRISARLPTRLEVGTDGQVRSSPGGSGVQSALARVLLIAAESATLGTWTRLKVCSADDCQWAFYDRSPTRNGCWCSMQICGSRAKSRAYRARAAASGPTARASRSAHTAAPGA